MSNVLTGNSKLRSVTMELHLLPYETKVTGYNYHCFALPSGRLEALAATKLGQSGAYIPRQEFCFRQYLDEPFSLLRASLQTRAAGI